MLKKIKQYFAMRRESKKPLFKGIKEKSLAKRQHNENQMVVAVPDIKEYLTKEYERVNALVLVNEGLKQELEQARETEMKYSAAMVTLDEYSKRLKQAEANIKSVENHNSDVKQELKAARDEINSYKIKFSNIAITKKELETEIVEEVKAELISILSSQKGNLSKKTVCEIIGAYNKEV